MRARRLSLTVCLASVLALPVAAAGGSENPTEPQLLASDSDLQSIGGRWYLSKSKPGRYYYDDGGTVVDLFSYHFSDSNKDGIPNVEISHDEDFLIVRSQCYPNHPTAMFPNDKNPNTIRVQDFLFRLPLRPRLSRTTTTAPMGPIGMALNGVVFFNPFEAGGMNAVEGYSEVWLDSCCGHPQQHGVYHYHKYPTCVKSPFRDDAKRHSPIIGFAFDGFPIHGPYEKDGVMVKDLKGRQALDACNGHSDEERGYHYHVTPGKFPYIIGGYAGAVELSNNHELRRVGEGALRDNSRGKSTLDAFIASVTPSTAKRGQQCRVQIRLNSRARRGAIPTPSWVQFGPYEASSIEVKRDAVVVVLDIPADANVEVPLDLHMEFGDGQAGEQVTVFKKNDAFRVVE